MNFSAEDIEDRIREADQSFNVVTISMEIVNLMKIDDRLTFADFEMALRRLGSDTFLIARPNRLTPPGLLVIDLFGKAVPTHHLWVCLHGSDERDEELKVAGTTEEQNLEALASSCGVLAVKASSSTG